MIGTREAANRLGIQPQSVTRLVRQGLMFPSQRINGGYAFSEAEGSSLSPGTPQARGKPSSCLHCRRTTQMPTC